MKVDYCSYTLEELYDVHENIDKDAYPERYKELLKELASREKEEAAKEPDEAEEIKKPKRKRTNKEKIITSSFVLIAAAACLYFGEIPGKHGGLSIDDDPIAFWITMIFCVGLAVYQLLTLEPNAESSVNDT